jgi:outer membrane biogenesis lipoprotein LolB
MRRQSKCINRCLFLGLLVLLLTACQKTDATAEKQVKEHIFSSQEKALRKAQQVQAVIDDHATKTREQIEGSFK